MAHTERLRIPESIHTAMTEGSPMSMSKQITKVMREFVEGKRTLDPIKDEGLIPTSITTDAILVEQVKDMAKSLNMSFNSAVIRLLEQDKR